MAEVKGRKLYSVERRAIERAGGNADDGAVDPATVAQIYGVGENSASIDTVLQEIAGLRADIASLSQSTKVSETDFYDEESQQDIRIEIAQMVRSIGRAKQEIASIKNPTMDEDHMETASKQLEAIVETTETATNSIMTATDDLEDLLAKIRSLAPKDDDIPGLVDDAEAKIIKIIESCSFQDLTGQRINEVVKTIRFIEARILAIIDIWGLEAFQDLPIQPEDEDEADDSEDALLNGPALGNQGLSQEDIDALFD